MITTAKAKDQIFKRMQNVELTKKYIYKYEVFNLANFN